MSSLEEGLIEFIFGRSSSRGNSSQTSRSYREEQYLARVHETTASYLNKYDSMLTRMVRNGEAEYVPDEVEELRSKLERARRQLAVDPKAAREQSFELGRRMSGLTAVARHAQDELEAKEQARRQAEERAQREARSAVSAHLAELALSVHDPVVADFAADRIAELRRKYDERPPEPDQLESAKDKASEEFNLLLADARTASSEWKQKKTETYAAESAEQLLHIHEEVAAETAKVNPGAAQRLRETLDSVRAESEAGARGFSERTNDELASAVDQADQEIADETARREVVSALARVLRKNGFELVGGKPKRQRDEDRDEVVILARKPSGNQAEFKIALDGRFRFHFDQYEGMACKKDIGSVTDMLQDIYGIKLSTERVLWENPDKIAKNAKPTGGQARSQS